MDLVSANFSYKPFYHKTQKQAIQQSRTACFFDLIYELDRRPFAKTRLTSLLIGVQQLDIVKFALPLEKISFHPIFSMEGKHTNFFMSYQAASRP